MISHTSIIPTGTRTSPLSPSKAKP
jgi:hypothetical protein